MRDRSLLRLILWPVSLVLLGLIRAYQYGLSPLLGPRCRYAPTCSAYAYDAVQQHGPLRGGWLAVKRVARCHPWGGAGYDPVPAASRHDSHPHR